MIDNTVTLFECLLVTAVSGLLQLFGSGFTCDRCAYLHYCYNTTTVDSVNVEFVYERNAKFYSKMNVNTNRNQVHQNGIVQPLLTGTYTTLLQV